MDRLVVARGRDVACGIVARFRLWFPLALVFLVVGLATSMSSPFLALFLTTGVHATPTRVAIYLFCAPLATVLLSSLLGRISDRYAARRPVLIGAALAGCVGLAVTAIVRDYWVLILVAVTCTATAFAVMPQAFAYARTVLGGVAMTMSALRTVFSLAWVAGPPLAALLLGVGGFGAVYGFGSAMYALAAIVILVGMPQVDPATSPGQTVPAPRPGPTATATPRAMWWTVGGFVLIQCATGIGVQALSLFIRIDLGGDVTDAGLLLGLCTALEIPLMLGLGVLATRVPLRRLVLAGPLLSVGYFTVVATATHTWQLGAAQLLNAGAIAAVQGLGVTYAQDLMPDQPGRASALFSNAMPAGAMIAGPVLGVAAHVGYRVAYVAAGVLAVGGFLLLRAGASARVGRSGRLAVHADLPDSLSESGTLAAACGYAEHDG